MHSTNPPELTRKYPLIIFDFDGTLAETFPWFIRNVNTLADRYHFNHLLAEELETLRGRHAREVMKYLHVPIWRLPWIGRDFRQMMAQDIHKVKLFPGVDRLLQKLVDRGATLAILSSNIESNVREVLGPAQAARIAFFECGVAMFRKPAGLRRLLKRTGFSAGDALCIGDEIRDADAAQKMKIAFAGVSWGYTSPEALSAHSAPVFTSLEDLTEKIV